jgi:hypothetical protein
VDDERVIQIAGRHLAASMATLRNRPPAEQPTAELRLVDDLAPPAKPLSTNGRYEGEGPSPVLWQRVFELEARHTNDWVNIAR